MSDTLTQYVQVAQRRCYPQNITVARLRFVGEALIGRADFASGTERAALERAGAILLGPLSHYWAVQRRGELARMAASHLRGPHQALWLAELLYLEQVAGLRPDLGLTNPLPAADVHGTSRLLTGTADVSSWLRNDYRARWKAAQTPGVAAK